MTKLSLSSEDVQDYTDLELIQHINVDCSRITRLLTGKFLNNNMVVSSLKILCMYCQLLFFFAYMNESIHILYNIQIHIFSDTSLSSMILKLYQATFNLTLGVCT